LTIVNTTTQETIKAQLINSTININEITEADPLKPEQKMTLKFETPLPELLPLVKSDKDQFDFYYIT